VGYREEGRSVTNRRITPEQADLVQSLFGFYGTAAQLTPKEIADWARGEKLPQPKAQHAQRACEALGIEAVWL
jgi:hypothetical protein